MNRVQFDNFLSDMARINSKKVLDFSSGSPANQKMNVIPTDGATVNADSKEARGFCFDS
jgi:hypothetical protein